MSLIDKIERRAPWISAPHVVLALVAGQTFFYLTGMLGMVDISRLGLAMELVRDGEWWRVLTFVFYPPATHWALVAFGLYCFYMIGGALEQEWGRAKLNLYLLAGYGLTLAAALTVPEARVDNYFAGGALFLAFAYLNPNYVFYVFMIVPVQVKYLALWLGFTSGICFSPKDCRRSYWCWRRRVTSCCFSRPPFGATSRRGGGTWRARRSGAESSVRRRRRGRGINARCAQRTAIRTSKRTSGIRRMIVVTAPSTGRRSRWRRQGVRRHEQDFEGH